MTQFSVEGGRCVQREGKAGEGPRASCRHVLTSGKVPLENTINKQVFPHAPSPTLSNGEQHGSRLDDHKHTREREGGKHSDNQGLVN